MRDRLNTLFIATKNQFTFHYALPKLAWHKMLIFFLNSISYAVVFFFPLYFTKVLNINIAKVGMMIAAYGFGKVFGGLIGGRLSDKYSNYLVSAVSLFIKSLAIFALLKLKLPLYLMIDLFILGFCEYSFTTANNVWILEGCESNENEKLKTISLIYVVLNIGIALSACMVGFLSIYEFNKILILTGLLPLISLSYLIKMGFNDKNKQAEYSLSLETISKCTQPLNLNKKIILCVLICLFLGSLIVSQIGTTYGVFIQEKFPQLGMKGVSILFALNPLVIILFQTPFINFCKKFNKIIMAGIGGFLMGIGMLILNFSIVFFIAIIACLLYTLGEMLFFSAIPFLCYQQGESNKKGYSLGRYQMVYAASSVCGPVMGGLIYHHLGNVILWYLCGALGLLCLLLCNYGNKYCR